MLDRVSVSGHAGSCNLLAFRASVMTFLSAHCKPKVATETGT